MADNISVAITADATQLRAQLALAQADVRAYSAELRKAAADIKESGAASAEQAAALDKAASGYNVASASVRQLRTEMGEGRAAAVQAAAGAEQVATANTHMGANAGVTRELLVMLHETMMGNYKRLAGSTVVLAERTNVLHSVISSLSGPMGLAVGAAAALAGGLVMLALRAHETETALRGVYDAALLQGRGAAAAEANTKALADRMTETGQVGGAAAMKMAAGIERLPHLTDATRQALADLAPALQQILGQSDVDKTTEEFTKLFSTTAGLRGFVEENALLTGQAHQQFLAAVQGDDVAKAAELAMQGLTARVKPGWDEYVRQANAAKMAAANALVAGEAGSADTNVSAPTQLAPLRIPDLGSKAPDESALRQQKIVEEGNKSAVELEALQQKMATAQDAGRAATDRAAAAQRQLASASDGAGRAAAQAALTAAQSDQVAAANAAKHYQTEIDLHREQGDASWAEKQRQALDAVLLKAGANATTSIGLERAKAQATVQFWDDAAKQQGLTETQRTQAQNAATQARLQLQTLEVRGVSSGAKAALEAKLAAIGAEQAANHDNYTQVMALEQQKLALLRNAYGQDSRQYQQGLKEQENLARQHNAQLTALRGEDLASSRNTDQQAIGTRRSELEEEVAAHQISKSQELAQLRAFTDQKRAEEVKQLENFIATLDTQSAAYHKFSDQLVQVKAKWASEDAALGRQATQNAEQQWQGVVGPVTSAFDTAVSGVIQGTQTIGQAGARAAGSLILSFARAAVDSAGKWVAGQLAMATATQTGQAAQTAATTAGTTARNSIEQSTGLAGFLAAIAHRAASWLGLETAETATTTAGTAARSAAQTATLATNVASAESYAAVAAVAAAASVAAIPVVGWAAAPGVAASTYATMQPYAALASAAGGWDKVPADGTLTELHKNEMVLPSSIASPLRSAIGNLGSGASGAAASLVAPASPSSSIVGASAGSSTTNNQVNAGGFNPSIHMTGGNNSPQDMSRVLAKSQKQFMSEMWNMTRNGNLRVPRWSAT